MHLLCIPEGHTELPSGVRLQRKSRRWQSQVTFNVYSGWFYEDPSYLLLHNYLWSAIMPVE